MSWEYQTVKFDFDGFFRPDGDVDINLIQRHLNEFGKEGWELVNLFDTNKHHGGTRFIIGVLKRPSTASKEQP